MRGFPARNTRTELMLLAGGEWKYNNTTINLNKTINDNKLTLGNKIELAVKRVDFQ